VFYASNVLVNKFVVDSFSTSQAMFWHGVVATLFGVMWVPTSAWSTIDGHAATFLAALAIGPGALGGLAFVWGLRRMPAAHASTLTLLEPLVSVLIGAGVLGERVGARAFLGGALILAGAVAVMTQARAPTAE
ncbi:MAG: DMT family transporter, partial [Myxococcota bacterium]|nr:DMT family transporter [Myxococcota bacterium]